MHRYMSNKAGKAAAATDGDAGKGEGEKERKGKTWRQPIGHYARRAAGARL